MTSDPTGLTLDAVRCYAASITSVWWTSVGSGRGAAGRAVVHRCPAAPTAGGTLAQVPVDGPNQRPGDLGRPVGAPLDREAMVGVSDDLDHVAALLRAGQHSLVMEPVAGPDHDQG